MTTQPKIDHARLGDHELARLLGERDPDAVRLVTTRNNQQLFRAAWAILGDRAEAEDAVQSAYLNGFAAIASYAGRSSLSTWLTRIVINEALGRARAARRRQANLDAASVVDLNDYKERLMRGSMQGSAPDADLARREVRRLLERAIDDLPGQFRLVFVLRDVEGLSTEETAHALGLPPATVKTRLHRARHRLKNALAPELRSALTGSFPFAGVDCAAMTERVLAASMKAS